MKRLLLAVAALLSCLGQAAAQDWPSKPIKFVVPFAAGSATDQIGRAFQKRLRQVGREHAFVRCGPQIDLGIPVAGR